MVEAQGGNERAKYGNGLIKEWSIKYTEKYGKGYDATNLRKFRQFYIIFPKCAPLGRTLSWSHYRTILPIQEENKRNYYINLCITKNLSRRELEKEIKNNSYERLLNKPEKIEIIVPQKSTTFLEQMKNPILIEIEKGNKIKNEHDLETTIFAKLQNFLGNWEKGLLS